MANNDLSSTTYSMSRKYRILTDSQLPRKQLIDDIYTNVVPTIGNNSISRLPSLLSKSSVFSSTPGIWIKFVFFHDFLSRIETVHSKKSHSKPKTALTKSSSFKIERQKSNIISQTRLPTLNDNDQKRRSELQRRQVCLNAFKIIFSSIFILIDLCIKSFHAGFRTREISTILSIK
jgi:hypothetical protein